MVTNIFIVREEHFRSGLLTVFPNANGEYDVPSHRNIVFSCVHVLSTSNNDFSKAGRDRSLSLPVRGGRPVATAITWISTDF